MIRLIDERYTNHPQEYTDAEDMMEEIADICWRNGWEVPNLDDVVYEDVATSEEGEIL